MGEYIRTISLRIKPADTWQPPLDFAVRLESPSPEASINHASQLDRARVWILHAGRYPTDKIDASSSRAELLKEFCRKCLANDIVRRGTIKTLLVDQLQNLVYLWQLWLSVLFIDHVLDATVAHDGGVHSSSAHPHIRAPAHPRTRAPALPRTLSSPHANIP